MSSFVSSILHSSANKFDSKYKNKSKDNNDLGSRLSLNGSTPILSSSVATATANGYYYHHPQKSYSAEFIPAPPPYDIQHSPVPTPSTSWTSEMSALAEKIKDDVTNTFKSNKSVAITSKQSNIDRRSISQGMKLVSIAADEYEGGNEADALGIYLTGVDKILMALPNKTDINTKIAIKEKLSSVEERVGLINTSKKIQQQQQQQQREEVVSNNTTFQLNSFLLSRIVSTISTISTKAYQSATTPINSITEIDNQNDTLTTTPLYLEEGGDTMIKFKKLGQYLIDVSVTCAILIKQSPIPDLVSFLFSYIIQFMIWIDSHYHITQKAQDLGVECIKVGLAADEKYRLHEFVTEGLYMLITAGLKAMVAFKEAPRHDEHIKRRKPSIPEPQTPCLPPTPQKTRTSWAWSRW
ncbi:hypothetical protein BD770DRAFT_387700 [Pilaira anomala]|nr:hypothetical protein BD770DRAFT_387700 [Pilaira anomala]